MTGPQNTPKPPEKLPLPVKRFWEKVVSEYQLEPHHLELLGAACHQLARTIQARKLLAEQGLTVNDRFGQLREHPMLAIERSSSLAFQRLMRELGLDLEPASALRGPARPGARQ